LSREAFLANLAIQGDTCYLFLTAIQGCIDIGAELIAILGLRKPTSNADIFTVLAEEGIVPQDLLPRLWAMIRFRNILAHKYRQVDFSMVYKTLQGSLGDFGRFADHVVRFIEAQESQP